MNDVVSILATLGPIFNLVTMVVAWQIHRTLKAVAPEVVKAAEVVKTIIPEIAAVVKNGHGDKDKP